jgi:hypothetical protein
MSPGASDASSGAGCSNLNIRCCCSSTALVHSTISPARWLSLGLLVVVHHFRELGDGDGHIMDDLRSSSMSATIWKALVSAWLSVIGRPCGGSERSSGRRARALCAYSVVGVQGG